MNRLRSLCSILVWALLAAGIPSVAVAQEAPISAVPRKAALLVENRAGEEFKRLAALLEDQLSSRAAGQGLVMISRQLVTDTIAKEGSGAQWDALLSERTSALRLAQSLGADFVVLASLSSVTREERTFNDGTLQLTSHNHVLRECTNTPPSSHLQLIHQRPIWHPSTSSNLPHPLPEPCPQYLHHCKV